jgi:hypothetical protein
LKDDSLVTSNSAATGRFDGLGVIGGMLAGIAVFNAVFDRIASFYESTALGAVTLTDLAGVSRGAGVACVTVMALAGFALAARMERARR